MSFLGEDEVGSADEAGGDSGSLSSETVREYCCFGCEGGCELRVDGDTGKPLSLYAQLCGRAMPMVYDYFALSSEVHHIQGGATLGVYFLFLDAGSMAACWHMLKQTLRVTATGWRTHTKEGDVAVKDGRWSRDDVVSFALLLRPSEYLRGTYSAAEVDRKLEEFLGCRRARGRRMNPVLKTAVQVTYELVPEDGIGAWVADRADLFCCCSVEALGVAQRREVTREAVRSD